MTSLAGYLSQDHMPPMGEKDVIRLPVDMSPWDLLLLFFILSDFFFFWITCDWFFMAFQTDCNARQSGKGLGFVVSMAGVALQPLIHMLLMIERDGLPGLRAYSEADEEEKQ
jgi:hypothetical protein